VVGKKGKSRESLRTSIIYIFSSHMNQLHGGSV
jgi:hypothetical protein